MEDLLIESECDWPIGVLVNLALTGQSHNNALLRYPFFKEVGMTKQTLSVALPPTRRDAVVERLREDIINGTL